MEASFVSRIFALQVVEVMAYKINGKCRLFETNRDKLTDDKYQSWHTYSYLNLLIFSFSSAYRIINRSASFAMPFPRLLFSAIITCDFFIIFYHSTCTQSNELISLRIEPYKTAARKLFLIHKKSQKK